MIQFRYCFLTIVAFIGSGSAAASLNLAHHFLCCSFWKSFAVAGSGKICDRWCSE